MIYNIICGDKLFYAYGNQIIYSSENIKREERLRLLERNI